MTMLSPWNYVIFIIYTLNIDIMNHFIQFGYFVFLNEKILAKKCFVPFLAHLCIVVEFFLRIHTPNPWSSGCYTKFQWLWHLRNPGLSHSGYHNMYWSPLWCFEYALKGCPWVLWLCCVKSPQFHLEERFVWLVYVFDAYISVGGFGHR